MAKAMRMRKPATWQPVITMPRRGSQHLLRARVSGSDDDNPPDDWQPRGGRADAALRD